MIAAKFLKNYYKTVGKFGLKVIEDLPPTRILGAIGRGIIGYMGKHSGIIGKTAGFAGRILLGRHTRNLLSNAADYAVDIMPKSVVRDALKGINDAAQGRNPKKDTKQFNYLNAKGPQGKNTTLD